MKKLVQAYDTQCKPLCQELKLPKTAFDILMFLGNNPEYKTATDIVEVRGIKANLVSINVEKLVKEGLLVREADPNDRRKVRLSCTKKALPIIEKGRKMQEAFQQALFAHTDEETMQTFVKTLSVMNSNMDTILEGE
ncbi:MAG: MarR family winged helix-turn-helix transcriptional regulator [Lachnospiraceae bacterium]